MEDVLTKNGVLTDGLERRYLISTDDRRLDMDSVTPIELTFKTRHGWGKPAFNENSHTYDIYTIASNSWNELLANLIGLLESKCPKSEDELLEYEVDWSSAKIFRETKDIVNMVKLDNGLYFSRNHSANHSQWLIQELLDFYGCCNGTLIVHRPPFSEPQEVRDYIKDIRVAGFKKFLIETYKVTEEKANKVVDSINGPFNKVLCKISQTAYNDFLLVDSKQIYSTLKSKFLAGLPYVTSWNDKQINTCKKYLDYLTDYFRDLHKESMKHKEDLEYQISMI